MFLTVVTAMPLSSPCLLAFACSASCLCLLRNSQFSTAFPICATSSSDTLQSVTIDEKSIYRATSPLSTESALPPPCLTLFQTEVFPRVSHSDFLSVCGSPISVARPRLLDLMRSCQSARTSRKQLLIPPRSLFGQCPIRCLHSCHFSAKLFL